AVLHELARHDGERGLDLAGTVTFVLGLTALVLAVSRGGLSGWNDPVVLGGFAIAAVLLPTWVVIEHRGRAPMLDLTIFSDRLFAAASVATFINGLVRFALMFIFVFYFQGAQGDSPITAGLKLSPLAIGMLISSPLAGRYADRHGSRALAAAGMLVTAGGLGLMTGLGVGSSFLYSATALAIVGIGSGMFMSPNTAAMMGAVPAHRRGVAAGARMVLQNTGSVLSIAFVLAVVTAAIPKATLFRIFSGLGHGLASAKLAPFINNMHAALWAMVVASLLGAVVSVMRPAHRPS
ncbi:MAG: MFS transporter, partial [Solirubrobacteraceae bacterium]